MRISKLQLLFAAVAVSLGGCAHTSKFACPNPHGVTCMSTQDVYKATNQADEIIGIDPKEARELSSEGKPAGKVLADTPTPVDAEVVSAAPAAPVVIDDRRVIGTRLEGDTLVITGVSTADDRRGATPYVSLSSQAPSRRIEPSSREEAYREPARIMSVYVRPYEDENGDLHLGSYVQSEIEPRKWAVAEKADSGDGYFQLLNPPKTPEKGQDIAAKPAPSNDKPAATAASHQPKEQQDEEAR